MSKPLPLAERKELARLKIAFYRDQVSLNSEPILHPVQYAASQLWQRTQDYDTNGISSVAGPALAVGALLLLVKDKPLGKLNKLVRLGLAIYPLLRSLKRS